MIFVVYTKENSNYMKKSKIIVPALGLLLLSTAASVSGTVAWFTANNKYNTTINTFAVVKTNDDLQCVLAGGVGTSVESNAVVLSKEISSTTYTSKLTDASFDPVTNKLVEPDANGEKVKASTLYSALSDSAQTRATIADPATKIYSCVTWTMTFKVSFGAVNTNYALFLDNTSGHTAFSGGNSATGKGFRIAFVTSDATRILADYQTATNCKYTSGALAVDAALPSASTATAVPTAQIMDSTYATALPTSEVAYTSVENRADCLGLIEYSANSVVDYVVTCVAYFEGTDPEIINRDTAAEYETVNAALHFQICKVTL